MVCGGAARDVALNFIQRWQAHNMTHTGAPHPSTFTPCPVPIPLEEEKEQDGAGPPLASLSSMKRATKHNSVATQAEAVHQQRPSGRGARLSTTVMLDAKFAITVHQEELEWDERATAGKDKAVGLLPGEQKEWEAKKKKLLSAPQSIPDYDDESDDDCASAGFEPVQLSDPEFSGGTEDELSQLDADGELDLDGEPDATTDSFASMAQPRNGSELQFGDQLRLWAWSPFAKAGVDGGFVGVYNKKGNQTTRAGQHRRGKIRFTHPTLFGFQETYAVWAQVRSNFPRLFSAWSQQVVMAGTQWTTQSAMGITSCW